MAVFFGNKQFDIFSAVSSSTSAKAEWGSITGTLSDQTDLQDRFAAAESNIAENSYGIQQMNVLTSDLSSKTDAKISQLSNYVRDEQTLQLGDFIDVLGTYMSKVVATDMTQAEVPSFVAELHEAVNSHDPRGYKRVVCWGDSLTKRCAPNVRLKKILDDNGNNLEVVNNGVSWDKSYQIALRQGAIEMKVNPFTVPASGPVNITYPKWNGKIDLNVYIDGAGAVFTDADQNFRFNPCVIDGIAGNLSRTSTEFLTFTRIQDGEAKNISRPVTVSLNSARSYNNIDDIAIVFAGTNDGIANVDQAIEFTELITENIKSKKFIVVGLEAGNAASGIEDAVFKQAKAFGTKFLNIYERMLNYGIADYEEMTGTALDETTTPKLSECQADVAEGRIPRCLRVDNTHFNETGYDLLCKLVYEKGKELKYWN